MCLPPMTQAGREHTTQCINLVHTDELHIVPQRLTFEGLGSSHQEPPPKPMYLLTIPKRIDSVLNMKETRPPKTIFAYTV